MTKYLEISDDKFYLITDTDTYFADRYTTYMFEQVKTLALQEEWDKAVELLTRTYPSYQITSLYLYKDKDYISIQENETDAAQTVTITGDNNTTIISTDTINDIESLAIAHSLKVKDLKFLGIYPTFNQLAEYYPEILI